MLSLLQIKNLLKNLPFLAIVALGQSFAIISGGLDLSVANVVTLTNVLCCLLMNGSNSFVSTFLAVAIPLLVAVLVGVFKGVLIAKLEIIPMIATLSVNYILHGVALILTNGISKGRVSRDFVQLAEGDFLGVIPNTFLILLIISAYLIFIQTRAKYGRELFATGSNRASAHHCGVKTDYVIIRAYVISSLCAAMSGILLSSYIELPSFDLGEPYAINSIASCVVGGVAMSGGVGRLTNVLGGAAFMTLLNTLLSVLKMPSGVQNIIRGVIIIIGLLSTGNLRRFIGNIKKRKTKNTLQEV